MLLVVQAVAIALGALPVFWLARKHLGSARAGLGFALAYLLYPATGWLALNEFHPVALATPLLLFAFWYLDDDRLLPFAVFALAACACKEEIPLVVAGFGIWYALSRKRWAAGAAIAAAGAAWSAIAIGVVIPHYNAGAESDFYGRYSEVGGSAGGIVKTAFTHPGRILEAAFSSRDLHYLWQLVAPLAGLCLLSPLVLIAALPELAINLLSATTDADVDPLPLHGRTDRAARDRSRLRRRALPALRDSAGHGRRGDGTARELPPRARFRAGATFPAAQQFQATAARVTDHDRIAERALERIPDNAVVSATNTLGAHLSARRRVLSFPFLEDATWIAADETQPGYADRYAPLPTAVQLDVRYDGTRTGELVFEQDGVLVFSRATA